MTTGVPRNIALEILDRKKIADLHDASMHLIEKVGMKITGDRTLDLLRAQQTPDPSGRTHQVHFKEYLSETVLDQDPQDLHEAFGTPLVPRDDLDGQLAIEGCRTPGRSRSAPA